MKLKATLLAAVVIVAAVLACGGTETPATAPSREIPALTQPLESQLLAPTTSLNLTPIPGPTQLPTDLSQVSPTPTHIVHIVQSGETLGKIAKQYGVSVEALVAANNIADPSLIRVGQTLVIPPADAIVTSPPTGTPAQASSQPGATSIATFEEAV
jgi:LysM repeat protein